MSYDVWSGDEAHPDWVDYIATNLLDALELVPDTGNWHGALRQWCLAHKTGRLMPNRQPLKPDDQRQTAPSWGGGLPTAPPGDIGTDQGAVKPDVPTFKAPRSR